MSTENAGKSGSVASPLLCPSCGDDPYPLIDVCQSCGGDFGDSGQDANGWNCTCVNCRKSNVYDQCCRQCREALPVEMWN